ncbi:hypothetical protein J0673_21640 [Vibrio sp. Vb2736]|nr:hypothetical protein [Vibrio sp. Vb2736]MBO0138914.1 hypothetical protein [Vibrio sp. Vb2736]MDF5483368.1 hypothetical protein [Vibrio parahaemolyticus]MDG2843930.1 hypothetical protein [Vibrio parahaemolyticus]MDG2864923.1 hypothetical protein [Vibrio parahaemolyticus]
MTTVKHTIQRGEIYHFNHRIGGIVYRKSLKTDSPSTSRQYVSDILSFIEQGKVLGVSVEKEDIDQFIEMLISNKVNEIVRLGKAVTEPMSATAKSYFDIWFHQTKAARDYNLMVEESSSSAPIDVDISTHLRDSPSYNQWLTARMESAANHSPLVQDLSQWDEDEGWSINEDHQFYWDFRDYTSHASEWESHLDSEVTTHAKNLAHAYSKGHSVRARMELGELKTKFAPLLSTTPPSVHQVAEPNPESESKAPLFEDMFEDVKQYIIEVRKLKPKTAENKVAAFKDFVPAFQGLQIDRITFEDLEQMWNTFVGLPKLDKFSITKYGIEGDSKEEKRLSRWELVASGDIDVDEEDMLKASALGDKVAFLKDIFITAMRKGYITTNPLDMANLVIPEYRKTTRAPLSKTIVAAIETHALGVRDSYSMAILMMVYHGMRPSEITSLTKSQVVTDEDTNVVYFNILSGKTANAIRKVPVHRKLLKAGFRDYVDSCSNELFKFTRQHLTNYFNVKLRPMFDIPSKNSAGELQSLYSLRHNVISQLGHLSTELKYRLVGHGTKTVTTSYTSVELLEAQRIINKIQYQP